MPQTEGEYPMTGIRQFQKSFFYTASTVVCGALAVGLMGSLLRAGTTGHTSSAASTPITAVRAPAGKEIATLAAGCFWSMEAIFEQLKGVEKVEPGYAGGHVANPSYEKVCSGSTGHAEAVNIVFDPKVISYRELLQVMLTLRDPTTLNRQGPDVGTNYRSVIFYHNKKQMEAAQAAIREVTAAKIWKSPIVTTVMPFTNFYQAEDYHRDYYRRHPDEGYSRQVIAPEIADLREKFASRVKS
jgi:peptide-methionine (S)-S-oxide reductase